MRPHHVRVSLSLDDRDVPQCLAAAESRSGSLLKNWKAACLLPFVHLGIARDYWSEFDRYIDMETGHGSTFFVIPRGNYPGRTQNGSASPMRACRYDVGELLPQLKRIASADCEVGVHGLDAWLDAERGTQGARRASRGRSVWPSSECACTGCSLMRTLPCYLIKRDSPTIRP